MQIFSPKAVARLSHDVCVRVANLSLQTFGEFTMQKFCDTRTNVIRQSCDSLEKTWEHLATLWRETKTKQHSYECRETLSRMSLDCHTDENETKAAFVETS